MKIEYKYTVDDVAKMLNVSGESVRRWCRTGSIKALKLPGVKGKYRFSKEAINDFIAKLNTMPVKEAKAAKQNQSGRDE